MITVLIRYNNLPRNNKIVYEKIVNDTPKTAELMRFFYWRESLAIFQELPLKPSNPNTHDSVAKSQPLAEIRTLKTEL